MIASNVWLITERSQLRNENDQFKIKFDEFKIEMSSNFEKMEANFNVTAYNTDVKDSFDNSESDSGMDCHNLTKNFTSLWTQIDDFKIKLDQHDANYEGIKADFNVTGAQITDLKDSFENSEAEKLEMSNTIDKLKVG